MELPNRFKIIWWIGLLVVVTSFIWQRYTFFINGTATLMDIFIFLIWISLLLVPLFQEVSFFGVKLKTEIESLKSEMKEQITNLRSEIQNTIDIRTQFNPQIYLNPPPDSQLPAMEERFRQILDETLRMQGIRPTPAEVETSPEAEVPSDTKFLFSIRYVIEKEMRRILKQRLGDEEHKRQFSINQMTRSLVESGLIDSKLANVIREVSVVCSPAIHGEQISNTQVRFVRDIAPRLIETLRALQ